VPPGFNLSVVEIGSEWCEIIKITCPVAHPSLKFVIWWIIEGKTRYFDEGEMAVGNSIDWITFKYW
jgi:hypothetical protein